MAEPTDVLMQIAADHVAPIREAWLNCIRYVLTQVSESQMASMLSREGYHGSPSKAGTVQKEKHRVAKSIDSVDELLDLLGNKVAESVVPVMTDAWLASGRKTSSVLPAKALVAPFSFDTTRVSALSSAGGYRAAFVVDVTEKQRETISQIINRGFIEGRSRAQVARDLRSSIGLTWKQEQWIENYRRQLALMDPAALDRALRDRRSDRLFNRLIDSGDMLTTNQINSMVERYRQRMVKWRAETIARTESLRAMRMGEWDALMAAHEAGALSPLLRRFWVVTADERLRRYHQPIPNMNPEGRRVDEPFQTPLGLMRYPLDPNGVARNVVNCRCRQEYRMPTASGEYKNVPVRARSYPGLEDVGDVS